MVELNDAVTAPERRAAYVASGQWDARTLVGEFATHVARAPQDIAVVDQRGARRFTWAALDRDSNRFARRLTDAGIAAGDVVAVQLPNWYEAVVADLATFKIGAVLNPLLPVYRSRELVYNLSLARTRALVTPRDYRGFDFVAMVDSMRAQLPVALTHIAIADPETAPGGLDELLDGAPAAAIDTPLDASRVSTLLFTSGTEAEPKAVMHTEQTANFAVRTVRGSLDMSGDQTAFVPSPIGHSTGLNLGLRLALFHGWKLVLQDRWSADDAIALIQGERCTFTSGATTFLRDVVERAAATGADVSSLKLFRSGGAPIPPELVSAAHSCGITALRLYGSTEILCGTINRRDSPLEKRVNTDGRAYDGVEVMVGESPDAPAPSGDTGEIFVRGACTSVGFLRDPERTARAFSPDGWVQTGDLGTLDREGYLTIVGRKKEIIIRGGLNVAPREVEDLILTIPGVVAAAVVGLPDARLGEIGCACVVLEPGARLGLAELVGHLKRMGLATFKLPERLEVLAELPMTPTGKVQKNVLVARLSTPSPL